MSLTISQEIVQFIEASGGQWKGFGEILNACGNKITAEKASQVFAAEAADSPENAKKDTEERVRIGRRRMITKALSQMVYYNTLECQDKDKLVHERMYRKGTGKSKSLASTLEEIILILNDAQDCFEQLSTGHDLQDFKKNIRSLKRIIDLSISKKEIETLKKENEFLKKRGNG